MHLHQESVKVLIAHQRAERKMGANATSGMNAFNFIGPSKKIKVKGPTGIDSQSQVAEESQAAADNSADRPAGLEIPTVDDGVVSDDDFGSPAALDLDPNARQSGEKVTFDVPALPAGKHTKVICMINEFLV
jgi:hypothetical protein